MSTLCVLIICFTVCLVSPVANSRPLSRVSPREIVDIDSTLPPLWDSVPDNLHEFPKHGNTVLIDPWNYLERMGLYKVLLDLTAPSMGHLGVNNSGNVLWGLPQQHGWQKASGRLDLGMKDRVSTIDLDVRISPCSWWAVMNYFLSVLPFLGAHKAGYMDHNLRFHFTNPNYSLCVQGSQPTDSPNELTKDIVRTSNRVQPVLCAGDNCSSKEKEAIHLWEVFFAHLRTGQYPVSEDHTLKLMWDAHLMSIEAGLAVAEPFLDYMSESEAEFGVSWSGLVSFIADTRFRTNLHQTNHFQVTFYSFFKTLLPTTCNIKITSYFCSVLSSATSGSSGSRSSESRANIVLL